MGQRRQRDIHCSMQSAWKQCLHALNARISMRNSNGPRQMGHSSRPWASLSKATTTSARIASPSVSFLPRRSAHSIRSSAPATTATQEAKMTAKDGQKPRPDMGVLLSEGTKEPTCSVAGYDIAAAAVRHRRR